MLKLLLSFSVAVAVLRVTTPISPTAEVFQVDVFEAGEDGYFAYRIPALETAPNGALLAFAEGRKFQLEDPGGKGQEIDLVMKRSTDGGAHWSAMQVIEHSGEYWSSANPCTLVDRKTGLVWLFYLRGKPARNTYTARAGTDDIRILARTSRDNGRTWSEAVDLTDVTRDMRDPNWRCSVVGPGTGIQTKRGRLVIPVWRYAPWGVFAVYSDDLGKSWTRGELVPGVEGDECQIVELADGSLLFDIRQQKGPARIMAVSSNGGATWHDVHAGQAVTPVCCSIKRLTLKSARGDKDRLLWTGPKGPGRRNLVARLSYDEGNSFPVQREIAPGFGAYSSTSILKDKSIGVLWERGGQKDYQYLTFSRFNLDWLEKQ